VIEARTGLQARAENAEEQLLRLRRWMYLWIALGAVIVLVVVGFLFAIAGDLEHIDDNLQSASGAVAGAEGDTDPLPAHIERINRSLVRVDRALESIPTRADQINANLDGVSGTLVNVEIPLADTSTVLADVSGTLDGTQGALAGTEPSLVQASGRLVEVRGLAGGIRDRLVLAQRPGSLGTEAIWRRVRFINGGRFVRRSNPYGLRAIRSDTRLVVPQLIQVNGHLESACQVIPPFIQPQLPPLIQPQAPPPSDGGSRC
jgi:hypothetical protein